MGGNYSWSALPIVAESITAVSVDSFAATPVAGGNAISLQTGQDVNNLGFNLYREDGGKRVKLNTSLLAGTALMGGAGTNFSAGQSRRWVDGGAAAGAVYWLEEVDLNGTRTWYGPAVAGGKGFGVRPEAAVGVAEPLQVAGAQPAAAGALAAGGGTAQALSDVGAATGANAASTLQKSVTTAKAASQSAIQRQYALAAGTAVALGVTTEGWYRVTQPQLVAAGLSPTAKRKSLQLYAGGVQQPIYVDGKSDSPLAAGDAVYFYGRGIDTLWSEAQTYWLVAGSEDGLRIDNVGASKGLTASASFPATVVWKPRTLYFSALLNGDGSNFFGPAVTDTPVSQALTVSRSRAGAASVKVKLQGVTAGQHSVIVAFNGAVLGTVNFSDQASGVATFALPAVSEGANPLKLTATTAGDVTLVDEVQLTYPHTYVAEGDALRVTTLANQTTKVSGFSSPSAIAIDVTNPDLPMLVQGTMSGSASNYALTVVPTGAKGAHTLLFLGSGKIQSPTVASNRPSSWHASQPGYDMVILGHSSLLPSAVPLAALRTSQGLKVAVIDVQDLYDEFNFGVKSPYALKSFLATAKANWSTKPKYVLLLGNGTVDPRNYLASATPDLVPAKLVETKPMETASDDWFVDFDDDGLPDMAIGRLPAESSAAADVMVARTVAYDAPGAGAWTDRVLLVSGSNKAPTDDFVSASQSVDDLLPAAVTATHLIQATDASPAANLVAGINAGQVLVNFAGHGAPQSWGSGLFSSAAALGLTNGAKTPLVIAMTCMTGYFQDVYSMGLGKALLSAPAGGAVAVWASSGLTDSDPQAVMNQAMVKALYGPTAMTVGEAAAAAKAATTDLDVRRTWNLLGDPSIVLH